jgi:hypothetical protein
MIKYKNMEWNSTNLIGTVKERFKEIFRPDRRWDVWRGFYNGWLEGRTDMLNSIRKDNPIAYEFHNYETGHCYVDYVEREGMTEKEGYTKISLHKI